MLLLSWTYSVLLFTLGRALIWAYFKRWILNGSIDVVPSNYVIAGEEEKRHTKQDSTTGPWCRALNCFSNISRCWITYQCKSSFGHSTEDRKFQKRFYGRRQFVYKLSHTCNSNSLLPQIVREKKREREREMGVFGILYFQHMMGQIDMRIDRSRRIRKVINESLITFLLLLLWTEMS